MDIWNRLSTITALRFEACSTAKSGWNGTGEGTVTVDKPTNDTIIFAESGQWQPSSGNRLNFSNTFRWTVREPGRLVRLEHLRFGPDRPVYLFDLACENETIWKSVLPHVCQQDQYSTIMTWREDHLELQWSIRGPHKNEDIRYCYW